MRGLEVLAIDSFEPCDDESCYSRFETAASAYISKGLFSKGLPSLEVGGLSSTSFLEHIRLRSQSPRPLQPPSSFLGSGPTISRPSMATAYFTANTHLQRVCIPRRLRPATLPRGVSIAYDRLSLSTSPCIGSEGANKGIDCLQSIVVAPRHSHRKRSTVSFDFVPTPACVFEPSMAMRDTLVTSKQ